MSVVRSLRLVVLSVALAFVAVPASMSQDSFDAGSVRFRKAFIYAGETFDAGRYQLTVEPSGDGPMIVLAQDGTDVLRELAIVQDSKRSARRASSWLVVVPKDDNRIRLTVRHGAHRYLAFFESSM